MVSELFNSLAQIDPKLAIFIVSMIPMVELRGGVILGIALGMNWLEVFLICMAGNLVPIPVIIILGRYIIERLGSTKSFGPIVERYKAKTLSKSGVIDKYGPWGLVLFVGIPIPGTGVWTGSVLALLMDLRMKKAIPAMILGMIVAGVIMTLGSLGVVGIIR